MSEPASPRRDLLALLFLWTTGVSWPLLSALAADGPSLLARRPTALDLVLLGVIPTLVAPLAVALGLRLLAAARDPVSAALPHVLAGVLMATTLLHLADRGLPEAGVSGDVLLVLSALLAGGLAAAWARWSELRRLAAWGSPLALVVLGAFLSDDDVAPLLVGPERAPGAAPVIVVALDSLPMDSLLGAEGWIEPGLYPQLARLAGDALLLRNASTVHEDPERALRALLCGRQPDPGDEPVLDLFGLLAPTHRTVTAGPGVAAQVPAAQRRGEGPAEGTLSRDALLAWARAVLPPPFDSELPPPPGAWRPADEGAPPPASPVGDPVATFRGALDALRDAGPSPLLVLRSPLPGLPWRLLPDGSGYGPGREVTGLVDGVWSDETWASARGLQRHLLQLGAVDRLVGELLDVLEQTGLDERAVVVVTALRGASFAPGSAMSEVSVSSAPEVLSVPLLIRAPGLGDRRGAVDDRNVELIDVLPTLAELLGRPVDPGWDGLSVLSSFEPSPFKTCGRRGQSPMVLSGEAPARRPAVVRRQRLLGEHPTWRDVERLAPDPDLAAALLDQPLGEVGLGGLHPARVQLHALPGRADERPLLIQGQVLAVDRADLPKTVAVAADDVILALAPTRRGPGGQVDFEVLLPPDAVPSHGRLGLAAYAVDDAGALTRLAPEQWTPVRDATGFPVALSGSDGRHVVLRPNAFGAFLDTAQRTPAGVRLQGWAGDRLSSRPADTILVFVEERFVYSHATGAPRPGVAAHTGDPALLGSGFDFEVPLAVLGSGFSSHASVFALVDDLATECVSNRAARWFTDLVWTDEGDHLAASDGAVAHLGDPDLWGAVESARVEGDRLVITGWSVDVRDASPVDDVLVMLDGQDVVQVLPGTRPRSVADLFGGREVEGAGFYTSLPMTWFPEGAEGRVTVIARRGERASRLRATGEAAWALAPAPPASGPGGDG